jgi:hypothetical protein
VDTRNWEGERKKIQSSGRKKVSTALARVLRFSLQFFDAFSVCLGLF